MSANKELDRDPRRSYPRMRVKFPVYWSNASVAQTWGQVRDISTGGLFMALSDPAQQVRAGTWIRLTIQSPSRKPLRRSGEVKWVGWHPVHKCNGAGVEFDAILNDVDNLVPE